MRALPRFAVLDALPEGYQYIRRITLESQRLLIALNAAGLALLIGAVIGYQLFYDFLQQRGLAQGVNPLAGADSLLLAVLTLPALFLMLSLHELIHGVAFQLLGAKPRYGFSLQKGVAFAAADRHYLTRDAYLIVGLAPLIAISGADDGHERRDQHADRFDRRGEHRRQRWRPMVCRDLPSLSARFAGARLWRRR